MASPLGRIRKNRLFYRMIPLIKGAGKISRKAGASPFIALDIRLRE